MPLASINIDLDTLSDDIDGDTRIIRSDELRAITYRRVMPRFLELLDRHGVKATFFVIGRDVADHADVLASIASAGHELANHTMTHPKQLVNLDAETIAREIAECERAIARVTSQRVVGFRAPGYTISMRVIDCLRRAGYAYDSSLNASVCYYTLKKVFKLVRLKDDEYISTQQFRDIFAPHSPYRMSTARLCEQDNSQALVEIPISVVPYVSYPFVTSLMLQFGSRPSLGALAMLVARNRFVNCELHINEFTDRGDVNGYGGRLYLTRQYMRIALAERMASFDRVIGAIRRSCDVVLLRDVRA